jgi:hypothetical protein
LIPDANSKHKIKTLNYNIDTKYLVLLHPTRIDRQMDRTIYKRQITALFQKLMKGKPNEISEIFNS